MFALASKDQHHFRSADLRETWRVEGNDSFQPRAEDLEQTKTKVEVAEPVEQVPRQSFDG